MCGGHETVGGNCRAIYIRPHNIIILLLLAANIMAVGNFSIKLIDISEITTRSRACMRQFIMYSCNNNNLLGGFWADYGVVGT